MKLYSFFNSSASYRVRIALAYRRMNSVGLVPTLVTDDGESLGQSLAIIDWLDRHFPQTPVLPTSDPARSQGAGNCLRHRLRYSLDQQHARVALPDR